MYEAIVNPKSKKINLVLLKQFIDLCQDSYLVSEQRKVREIKDIMQNVGMEDPPIKSNTKPNKNPILTELALS